MTHKPRQVEPAPPPALTSLSALQVDWLRQARDTEGGVYLPLTTPADVWVLVERGAATCREVRQSRGTVSAQDPRPCTWTDNYLVPTAQGQRLLLDHKPT